jgi:hypothetical protein
MCVLSFVARCTPHVARTVLLLSIGVPVAGQAHHADVRPDYLAEILPAGPGSIELPPPPLGDPPAAVRGIYLNRWVFGGERLHGLIRLADTTEINAFVIDVKDATGELTYVSTVPTAVAIGANRAPNVRNIRERLELLRQHGIHAIARIVVARDPLLARGKPQWAIHDEQGGLWIDGLGEPWVDAFNDSVWIYAAQLAEEAVLVGFAEIQFDYVRFPDEPPARLSRTVYPSRLNNEPKRAGVRRNVALVAERLRFMGVPFTLDVFGLATSGDGDLGIGQAWDDLSPLADVLLPMVYPSHYRRGAYGIAHPNTEPYRIVRRALEDGIARNARLRNPARIRPYLQSFSIFGVRYTAHEVREQIRATEDVGLTDWVMWNASGNYHAAAFRSSQLSGIRQFQ